MSIQNGQFAEAVRAFQEAIAADPGDVEALNNLGYAHFLSGNLETAEQVLFHALRLAPGRANAWTNLGQTYAKQKKQAEAVACFANAYRFSRNREMTRQFLRRLTEKEEEDDGVKEAARQTLQLILLQVNQASKAPDFSPFAKLWSISKNAGIAIDKYGHGQVDWRIYRWCDQEPTPPCDQSVNGMIIGGGAASIWYSRVEGSTAYGEVEASSDPTFLVTGPISITLEKDGHATLRHAGKEIPLDPLSNLSETVSGLSSTSISEPNTGPAERGQALDYQLSKMQVIYSSCELFFDITNSSKLNITFGNTDVTLREGDGSIIDKGTLLFDRVKPGQTIAGKMLTREGDCSPIKSVQLNLRAVEINGNLTDSESVLSTLDSGRKSSKAGGVTVR